MAAEVRGRPSRHSDASLALLRPYQNREGPGESFLHTPGNFRPPRTSILEASHSDQGEEGRV